jgi:AcrR family transcriptional regulator
MERDEQSPVPRRPLTKDRVLMAAVALADRSGLGSLTMRRLGGELGVEAMSLYKHIANKDEILDGIIDLVVGEIVIPPPGSEWKTAMRKRAVSARQVLRRHPWAIGLFESRSAVGPAVLRYLDAVIGSLRAGGFSVEAAAHAFWVLDSYVYGNVIQEMSLPFDASNEHAETTDPTLEHLQDNEFPHLTELAALQATTSAFDYDSEFEFGLNLVLDALDAIRTEA